LDIPVPEAMGFIYIYRMGSYKKPWHIIDPKRLHMKIVLSIMGIMFVGVGPVLTREHGGNEGSGESRTLGDGPIRAKGTVGVVTVTVGVRAGSAGHRGRVRIQDLLCSYSGQHIQMHPPLVLRVRMISIGAVGERTPGRMARHPAFHFEGFHVPQKEALDTGLVTFTQDKGEVVREGPTDHDIILTKQPIGFTGVVKPLDHI
jgi:hypothetical protein